MLTALGILIKILIVVGITQGAVAYLILAERKVAAFAQDRLGPNRAGREFGLPFGLLQPLADGAKMLLKEDVIPRYVNKPLYILAPMIAIIAATIGFAETTRLPFDLPDSEQELVGGFHTEYSAMKFGMFFLAEYLHVITVSYLTVILFLGGWDFPWLNQYQSGWLTALAKVLVMVAKV